MPTVDNVDENAEAKLDDRKDASPPSPARPAEHVPSPTDLARLAEKKRLATPE